MFALSLSLFLILSAVYLWRKTLKSWNKLLPPGPKPELIIGNVRQMDTSTPWLYYTELKKKYGDIVHLSSFGQPIIILNSYKAINDLVVQNAMYADRPNLTMCGDLVGWASMLSLQHYGPKWAMLRKAVHPLLNKNAIKDYWTTIENISAQFVEKTLDTPDQCVQWFQFATSKSIIQMTYGIHVESPEDPFITFADGSSAAFSESLKPGRFWVDTFPILKYVPAWFPFAGFQRQAVIWRDRALKGITAPFERVKQEMTAGISPSSFTSRILQDIPEGADENLLKWLSATLYVAAVDTTTITFSSFLLAMVLHPDVQRKAQEEIDRVIGRHRLPSLADRDDVPYLECVLKEVLRWHLVLPTSIPYRAMEDGEYMGYHIPKGSIIVANSWAVTRDPKMYPSPESFIPERFEGDNPSIIDPHQLAFGYGRRICPGNIYADAMLWCAIARLLATSWISKAVDESGNEITPEVKSVGGIVAGLDKFPYALRPRAEASVALAREASAMI